MLASVFVGALAVALLLPGLAFLMFIVGRGLFGRPASRRDPDVELGDGPPTLEGDGEARASLRDGGEKGQSWGGDKAARP